MATTRQPPRDGGHRRANVISMPAPVDRSAPPAAPDPPPLEHGLRPGEIVHLPNGEYEVVCLSCFRRQQLAQRPRPLSSSTWMAAGYVLGLAVGFFVFDVLPRLQDGEGA